MTKKADKWPSIVVWDRNDYIQEIEKQLNDINVYNDVCFNNKHFKELVGTSNKLLKLSEKLVTSNLNTLRINIKKLLKSINSIFYLR